MVVWEEEAAVGGVVLVEEEEEEDGGSCWLRNMSTARPPGVFPHR